MTPTDYEMNEYIYRDAVCPVCGERATYEPNPTSGKHAYYHIRKCGHSEILDIIQQRANEYIARNHPETLQVHLQ